MQRRTFLKDGLRASGGLAWLWSTFSVRTLNALQASQTTTEPQDDGHIPDWLRYAQAVYFDGYSPPVYPHMKAFDAKRLIDTVEELGGNLLRFQPIGNRAYYQSKILPLHSELDGRDLINEVSRECRRRGIHLYCYTGYGNPAVFGGGVNEPSKNPAWMMVDPKGQPYGTITHYGWIKKKRKVCTSGDAYRQASLAIVKELCKYDIDGIYFDSPCAYRGVCFCDNCRTNFKKATGLDLDQIAWVVRYGNGLPLEWTRIPSDIDMKPLIAWVNWANGLVQEDLNEYRRIIHGNGKFMMCHNGAAWTDLSLHQQYRVPDGFMVEAHQQNYEVIASGLMGSSMARSYGHVAQMYMGSYATTWFGEPPFQSDFVVHNTDCEDTDEIRMIGFTNLACGNAPIYATANRVYFKVGSGSVEPAREVFDFMKKAEAIHKDSVPVSFVSVIPTWESLQMWRTKRRSWNWPLMTNAFELIMLDERIAVDVNPSTELREDWLAQQQVIALCGASGISRRNADMLTRWVERGGGLLATYDTGLFDEQGELHEDGGALKEALGVEMTAEPLESQPDCYYRVTMNHPSLGQYAAGTILSGDGRLVPLKMRDGASVVAECWNLGTDEVRGPAIVVNRHGKGRTVYISGSLEGWYPYSRERSTALLFSSLVRYLAANAPLPFMLQAPQGIHGILRRATNGDLALWVLANVGSKDADVGLMRQDYVPVNNVEVRILIPDGGTAKAMYLARADHFVDFAVHNGYATVTIPQIHIAEVVYLRLS